MCWLSVSPFLLTLFRLVSVYHVVKVRTSEFEVGIGDGSRLGEHRGRDETHLVRVFEQLLGTFDVRQHVRRSRDDDCRVREMLGVWCLLGKPPSDAFDVLHRLHCHQKACELLGENLPRRGQSIELPRFRRTVSFEEAVENTTERRL